MAHVEQQMFFRHVKRQYPQFFSRTRVLDCGSLNVNGTVRDLFSRCEYIGVDIHYGLGVDVISLVHELPFPLHSFDVVVSAEMLEHDEYWKESLQKMYDLLRPRGLLAISMATVGRPEHGTTRTDGQKWGTSPTYYRNILQNDIQALLDTTMPLVEPQIIHNRMSHDLYVYGLKGDVLQ